MASTKPLSSQVSFTATGGISSTDLQSAVTEVVADLASTSGASSIGYIPSGTGAVASTVAAKLRESVSVKDFGAVGDGVTDDTAAIQAFFDAVTSNGLVGNLIAGDYRITSGLKINLGDKGFVLNGVGSEGTKFYVGNDFAGATNAITIEGGNTATYPGFEIGRFSIRSNGGYGACVGGLQVGSYLTTKPTSTGYNQRVVSGVFVADFLTGIQVIHARLVKFENCSVWNNNMAVASTCLKIAQTGLNTGDLVFDKCQFVSKTATGHRALHIASTSGPHNVANGDGSISGIKFRSCDFYAGDKSIYVYADSQSWITDLWFVDGCQVDQEVTNAVFVESKDVSTLIQNLHFDGLYVNKATSFAMAFTSTGVGGGGYIRDIWVDSCIFLQPQTTAITCYGSNGTVVNAHITDNSIIDCAATGGAIVFNQVDGITCTGNIARVDIFGNTPDYLIEFQPGCEFITCTGNKGVLGVDVNVGVILDNTGVTDHKLIYRNVGTADDETSANASDIVFTPSGTGATQRALETKLRESVSVRDFGAVGDGVTNDTVAFGLAAKGVAASVNIVGAEGTLPRAHSCVVLVPAGQYLLTATVDTGGRDVTWQLDLAATITGYNYLNGEVVRIGQRQTDYHHGTTDYACTYSIRSNTDLEDGGEILGITSESQLATYGDRDSVSLYVDNTSIPALIDVSTATYTATTVTVTQPSDSVLKQYRRGMIIDTKHSPVWSGVVESWNADGSVITVTGWYEFGGAGTPATPPGTAGCVLNGMTKIWAHNSNVFLSLDGYASTATGFELGLFNSKGNSSTDYSVLTNRCWGYDSVNLGTYVGQAAFMARGAWHHGYYARGQGTGFTAYGNSFAFQAINASGVSTFNVSGDGDVTIGRSTAAGTPYIDFASSGATTDYDARILSSGGSATTGQANLIVYANTLRLQNSNGLGYASGSGGQVTQLTSKATSVTLNKASGRITTASDSLASGAAVTFTVTNSTVSSADCVILNASSASYRCSVVGIAVGSFVVLLENRSLSSLAEAVTLNFAVIKGSIS